MIGIAAWYDVKSYRVPNLLIVVGLISGGIWQIFLHGTKGSGIWFVGVGIIWVVMVPFSMFRMFGAGDVKLFMVIGGFFGQSFTMQYAVVALFVGAIFSIGKMLWHRNLLDRLRYLASYLFIVFAGRIWMKYEVDLAKEKEALIPFVVPMAVAYVLVVYYVSLYGCLKIF